MTQLEIAIRLGVAALAGLAVGLEREWSGHASGPGARFAGVRTFFLLGAIGGVIGWLSEAGPIALAVGLLVVTGGLVVAAYLTAARRAPEAIDGTTEAAAILVLAVGVLAGRGLLQLGSGLAAVTVLALGEKDAIRRFVARIEPTEMRAALQFAVLALVVLPLLPPGPFGPYDAIRPRMIWTVVLLFSGLNFAGYLARKTWGDARGYLVTGALGGLVSSTGVSLSFSRLSRRKPERVAALAFGVVAACTVLVPRVVAITAALNPGFFPRAALALAPMLAVGLLGTTLGRPSETGAGEPEETPRNPLDLGQAIRMAIAFQLVLLVIESAQAWFGDRGVVAAAVLAGLTDVDALTMSMARTAIDPTRVTVAGQGLVAGVVANTILKTALVVVMGAPNFRRRVVPRMVALAAAGIAGYFLLDLWQPAR
jgi:uncharacterized membrane protein (DUF4010 family)